MSRRRETGCWWPAAALFAVVSALAGCQIETKPSTPSYRVVNGTDEVVELRYLTNEGGLDAEELEQLRAVAVIGIGESAQFGPLGGDRDSCLDAPLVALAPDGTEIDRLPTGTCAEMSRITWTITAE